jgi:adenylate cyclase
VQLPSRRWKITGISANLPQIRSESMQRRLAAILAADMVGYSRLLGADEEGTIARQKAQRGELIDPEIAAHGGRIVKTTGDGLLVEFPSVVDAVRCAAKVQAAMVDREAEVPEDRRIHYRIGINLGDIVIDGDDILGEGVNVAARLEGLAQPGGICISGSVYDQVAGKLDIAFADTGAQHVKNIEDPVRTYHADFNNETVAPSLDTSPPLPDKPSIAVLPFNNMSDNREYEYLADGLTEDIITLLARMPGFFVIARNSSFAYKGQSPDIRTVGRDLGVRYVVEGSLRPVGDRLRITIQLIEAASGNHLWANRIERRAEEFHEIQDEVTTGIVAQLEPELTRAEVDLIRRRPPGNMDAWSYYQQAHGLLSLKGWHRETFEEAADLLQKAIALEPEFALAHAYLSLLLALGHMFGLAPHGEPADLRAIDEAEQAMNIDSQNSGVLGYVGCALCDIGQTTRGLGILERAVEADPSNAQAWVALGVGLMRDGKARKGVEMLQHGMRISPVDHRLAYWGTNLAYVQFRLGRIDAALQEAELACRRDDKLYMARVVLALILTHLGRSADAEKAIAEARRVRPDLTAEDVRSLVGRRGARMLKDAALLE